MRGQDHPERPGSAKSTISGIAAYLPLGTAKGILQQERGQVAGSSAFADGSIP
jgi:hypothetical protein